MKNNQVTYYTHGLATVSVIFPEDRTVCQWCPYVKNEDSLKRHKCSLTGEYLPYPFTARGNQCPVEFERSDSDGDPSSDHW